MSLHDNLLGPEPTMLPSRPDPERALDGGTDPKDVVRSYPDYSAGWASLAEKALADGDPISAYAFARTGYHRGLDQLRRNGWKGFGPVPWAHQPNQGVLRAIAALAKAAGEIGEIEELGLD
jgi:hypothetical protein